MNNKEKLSNLAIFLDQNDPIYYILNYGLDNEIVKNIGYNSEQLIQAAKLIDNFVNDVLSNLEEE